MALGLSQPLSGGSPPLTREPLRIYFIDSHYDRITPAYAGTTLLFLGVFLCSIGSPPLTREPLDVPSRQPRYYRITPAYAGTTLLSVSRPGGIEDHPRLRGNHASWSYFLDIDIGSPPLTREPLQISFRECSGSRITPAYAGTTCCIHIILLSY